MSDVQLPLVRLKPHLRGINIVIDAGGSRRQGSIGGYKMIHLIQLLKQLRRRGYGVN